MKFPQSIFDGSEYKKRLEARRKNIALPVRRRGKRERLYIDKEYFIYRYGDVLSLSAFVVYAVLAKYANAETQYCWPSVSKIMRESGIKSRKTVSASLKQLEEYRLIEISHSKGRGSNGYFLIDDRSWERPNPVKISAEQGQNLPSTPAKNDPQSHINKLNNINLPNNEKGNAI